MMTTEPTASLPGEQQSPVATVEDLPSESSSADIAKWILRLYVAGKSPKCMTALENLKQFCEQQMPGEYAIEVIDLLENPRLAKDDQIVAIPTLVRKLPEPMRKIIGDLSNTDRLLVGLDLKTQ